MTDITKKAPKKKALSHPPAAAMVSAAIGNLKERNGSSLQAIKKYIAANYSVDIDRQLLYIKRALREGVTKGKLVQTSGKGAAGSFKLNVKAAKEEAVQKAKKEKEKAKLVAEREKQKEKKASADKKAKLAAQKKKKKPVKKPVKKVTDKKEKKKTPKKKAISKKSTPKKAAKKVASKKPKTSKAKKPTTKKAK